MTNVDNRIGTVVFDAMYTVITARGSRQRLIAKVFSEHLDRRVTAKQVEEYLEESRQDVHPTREYHRDWAEWNRRIIALIRAVPSEAIPLEEGYAVHQRILSDTSLYEVTRDMRDLLAFAQKHFRTVVASNQAAAHLLPMMSELGITEYFERVFTSDELGVSKPTPDFFSKVYAELGVDARAACYVGNSLRNDLMAAALGSSVIIYDVSGKISLPRGIGGVNLAHVVRSPRRMQELLEELGGIEGRDSDVPAAK